MAIGWLLNCDAADPHAARALACACACAHAQVGRGYLKREDLNRLKFVEHDVWGPCFRTGDVLLAAPHGWEFVGRRDFQVVVVGADGEGCVWGSLAKDDQG